jgi:hypothetical protein
MDTLDADKKDSRMSKRSLYGNELSYKFRDAY